MRGVDTRKKMLNTILPLFLPLLLIWMYLFHPCFRFSELVISIIFPDIDAELVIQYNHIVNGKWSSSLFLGVFLPWDDYFYYNNNETHGHRETYINLYYKKNEAHFQKPTKPLFEGASGLWSSSSIEWGLTVIEEPCLFARTGSIRGNRPVFCDSVFWNLKLHFACARIQIVMHVHGSSSWYSYHYG